MYSSISAVKSSNASSQRSQFARSADMPSIRSGVSGAGTDLAGFLTEAPVFNAFAMLDGVVHHTYSTSARGLEFLLGYYGILDRAPKGRDEGDLAEMWLRRHDEYDDAAAGRSG
jgi:predicted dithiol-disulfide oxidoreductase (DUF899 family)